VQSPHNFNDTPAIVQFIGLRPFTRSSKNNNLLASFILEEKLLRIKRTSRKCRTLIGDFNGNSRIDPVRLNQKALSKEVLPQLQ
jgi:hypothetical protein